MKIVRRSELTGKEHILDLDVTPEQMNRFEHRYITGEYIQTIFPKLKGHEREFIMTGITKQEWDNMFPPEDEDVLDEIPFKTVRLGALSL